MNSLLYVEKERDQILRSRYDCLDRCGSVKLYVSRNSIFEAIYEGLEKYPESLLDVNKIKQSGFINSKIKNYNV